MATRAIVPRADNEGGLGSAVKKWALGFIGILVIDSLRVILGAEAGKVLTCLDALGNAGWAIPSGVPAGTIIAYPVETPPTGYILCNGASLSRVTYAGIFAVIGTRYGAADSTHFNLPDYRGYFLRGWANGSTVDPDRATRTNRGDGTTGDVVGTKQLSELFLHTHGSAQPAVSASISYAYSYVDYDGSGSPTSGYYFSRSMASPILRLLYTSASLSYSFSQTAHTHTGVGGNENRSVNLTVAYMMKT
jgi:microcystin-dependent protein